MSGYDFRPGGPLKLKGGVAEGGIVKKKKKKSKRKEVPGGPAGEQQQLEKVISEKEVLDAAPGSGRNSPAMAGGNGSGSRKTEAEKRFDDARKKRLEEQVTKTAGKTHKDRVAEFNAKLEALSEHHDIPKVGPG